MEFNLYTMAVVLDSPDGETKSFEETTAYNETDAINNINELHQDDKNYVGCYVYNVEYNVEHPDIEDMMETRC